MSAGGEIESARAGPWLARCPECGYDLTGTNLDKNPCPECGWRATERVREQLVAREAFLQRRWRWVVAPLLGLGLAAFLVVLFMRAWVDGGFARLDLIRTIAAGLLAEVPLVVGVLGGLSCVFLRRADRRAGLWVWLAALPWLVGVWVWSLVVAVVGSDVLAMASIVLIPICAAGWLARVESLFRRAMVRKAAGSRGAIGIAFIIVWLVTSLPLLLMSVYSMINVAEL